MAETRRNWKEVTVDEGVVWDKSEPLEGKLINVEEEVGPNKSRMYTVKLDDDSEIKVWGSTVLDDRMVGVPPDTYIRIEHEGMKSGKNGSSYHSYKVFIDEDTLNEG